MCIFMEQESKIANKKTPSEFAEKLLTVNIYTVSQKVVTLPGTL